jgi:hypothetical protein
MEIFIEIYCEMHYEIARCITATEALAEVWRRWMYIIPRIDGGDGCI